MYDELLYLYFLGLHVGLIAVLMSWLWTIMRLPAELPPALLIVVAFFIALSIVREVYLGVWMTIALFTGSAWIVEKFLQNRFKARLLAFAASSTILAIFYYETHDWLLRLLLVASVVILSCAIFVFENGFDRKRWIPLLLLSSAGAIFVTVPDTEGPLVLLGIFTATLLFPSKSISRFFGAGHAAFAGMFMWMIFEAGKGRPASIMTVAGCLGIFFVIPILTKILSGRRQNLSGVLWFVLHCLSISIVINYARATSDLRISAIAAGVAILIPLFVSTLFAITRLPR